MSETKTTYTRAEARIAVAEKQGWRNIDGDCGNMPVPSVADCWMPIPDCFEPGAALALLWELPEHFERDWNGFMIEIKPRDCWSRRECWNAETIEQFAVAAVQAYLSAHAGKRVEIVD